MNLVTNTCFGGHYYRRLGVEFKNPFIWTRFTSGDFLTLVKNYDTLNFRNITSSRLADERTTSKFKIAYMTIDNSFEIEFVHYRQDVKASKPYVKEIDSYSSDPVAYAKEKYLKRLERMTDEPIFIFHYHKVIPLAFEDVCEFFTFDCPYRRYIVTEHRDLYERLVARFGKSDGILFHQTTRQQNLVAYMEDVVHLSKTPLPEFKPLPEIGRKQTQRVVAVKKPQVQHKQPVVRHTAGPSRSFKCMFG